MSIRNKQIKGNLHHNLGVSAKEKGFPGGTVEKNPPANAGGPRDAGSIPGLGRSPGVGDSTLLQSSCLENSMDRGAWWARIHEVTKSRT